ncbi:MAG: methyl-accepting chemotaxis protein [Nitrosopumilus sp.]|uniref:methyl-accepting chemotaxis protein n=1 Tax=Nitrosopumilus sp. TaxID=2024843 RepID=UPI00292E3CF6|nr:methyl-accepting chemotaxis protein [Nitrosopumilus sp.]
MKFQVLLIFPLIFLLMQFPTGFADLELLTNNKIFSEGQPLFIYGKGLPNENLIIRLLTPDETIAKFDQIATNDDGTFEYVLLHWPKTSNDFPFGTYTIELLSSDQPGLQKTLDVKFLSTSELIDIPVERQVNTLVVAPETAAINQPFRVFVQTTSDGLLVGNNPTQFLDNTHVHLPSGISVPLSNSFKTLHTGLSFVDYTPKEEGTHVFHVVASVQGTTSHGSAATSILSQDLGGISEQIVNLNSILNATSTELDVLKSEIKGFDNTLEQSSEKIDESTEDIATSIEFIGEASTQLNSLMFPIIASIGIIVALQITIIARRR